MASYVTGSVTGQVRVGGLIGVNRAGNRRDGRVVASYSAATVSGVENVGGLAGWNDGTISASYSRGRVRGRLRRWWAAGRAFGIWRKGDGQLLGRPVLRLERWGSAAEMFRDLRERPPASCNRPLGTLAYSAAGYPIGIMPITTGLP